MCGFFDMRTQRIPAQVLDDMRLAAALAIFMFSLAGIPPLFGFYAKFAVFYAAVQAGLFPLAVVGIAASTIGAYYYLRVVKTMYFDEPAAAFGAEPWPFAQSTARERRHVRVGRSRLRDGPDLAQNSARAAAMLHAASSGIAR